MALRCRNARRCQGDAPPYTRVNEHVPAAIRMEGIIHASVHQGRGRGGAGVWMGDAVVVLDRPATAGTTTTACVSFGGTYGLHGRSERLDEYSNHVDLRAGAAVDVGYALPRRAPFVSVDPVSPVGRCAWTDPGKAGRAAAGICALERRICASADGAISLPAYGARRWQ